MTTRPPAQTRTRRRPAARTALATAGVIGLASAVTLTAANWTETAEITGEVTTGSFSMELNIDDLGFEEFVPGVHQAETVTLTNASSTPAVVTLDIDELVSPVPWELAVQADGSDPIGVVPSGHDPDAQLTDLALGAGGEDLVIPAGEDIEITVGLMLVDSTDESKDLVLDDLRLTFHGEQTEITDD